MPTATRRYRDQGGRDRTDLTIPASWELYVDMRFDQLRTACDLELWAEAFRSADDIQVCFVGILGNEGGFRGNSWNGFEVSARWRTSRSSLGGG